MRNNRTVCRPAFMVTVLLVLYPVLMLALSCTGQPSPRPVPGTSATPSPPAPEPAPVTSGQTVEWHADGVISDGEYAGTQVFEGYELWWTSDNTYIYIGIKARTTGWVAMAMDSGQGMKDADMVVGFVQDDKVTVYDEYSTGNFGPHQPDTELSGPDDILDSGGKEEGGYTVIEFKRKLDTGDKYDHAFSPGKNTILWAYGADDQTNNKHISRGHGEIDL